MIFPPFPPFPPNPHSIPLCRNEVEVGGNHGNGGNGVDIGGNKR